MPIFYNENTRKVVQQEEFIEYYKKYFNQNINKIHKFLLALAYNDITNFKIEFDSKDEVKSFTLYLTDDDGDIDFLFEFYKNKNGNIKITFGTINNDLNIEESLNVLNIVKEASKFL